jgi:Rps23 Pro-64 3,4-dihydroxylase Tpa1-like proline 4-hydroxylase
MKVHTEPFHYIEIRNLWTKQERADMFDEILFLEKKDIFVEPEFSFSARHKETNELLKQNTCMLMDNVWADRKFSDILNHNRKTFEVFKDKKIEESWYFNELKLNSDNTLISYYENGGYYEPHRDSSVITILSWFFKEPKKFKGGSITFTEYNITFEVTNDLTLIFPSNILHEVSEVSIDEEYKGKQYGRFCMNQFLEQ